MTVTRQQLALFAPWALPVYVTAFEHATEEFQRFGITTPLRVAHFMAQIGHESGLFTILEENLNYSAKRMTQVWPKRFPTLAEAEPFAKNPQKFAEKVYGGRKDLGNVNAGDGYRYRGRGPIQLTGRINYRKCGNRIGVDLEGNPDLAAHPSHMLAIAGDFWVQAKCNVAADADDVVRVTRAVNGGLTGLDERRTLLKTAKTILVAGGTK